MPMSAAKSCYFFSIGFYFILQLISVRNVLNFYCRCQKVTAKLLFGRGRPAKQSAAFVGRLDNYVFALTKIFKCRPLFRRKVGKLGVEIEIKFIDVVTAFIDKKSKEANWPSGGVHSVGPFHSVGPVGLVKGF